MADNITAPATGAILATDDVGGGVQVPRVKVTWGADGTATDANATTPLPVKEGGAPADDYFAVTPSDSVALTTAARSLYVGGVGDVTIKKAAGATAVTFKAVPAGSILPVRAAYVMATNTTATNITALV